MALAVARPEAGRSLADGHRHQRQDHDCPDAHRDPEGGGPAGRRRGQHRRLPLLDAVLDPEPHDVIAVEFSSHQPPLVALPRSGTLGRCLNLAARPPRLARLRWRTYAADKGRIYEGTRACVYNVADPVTEHLVRDADVEEGAGPSASRSAPQASHARRRRRRPRRPGLRRAGAEQPRSCARSPTSPPTPRTSSPRLAAVGARPGLRRLAAGRTGLPSRLLPDAPPHRAGRNDAGAPWVDDSHASNPHAASRRCSHREPVVGRGSIAKGVPLRRPDASPGRLRGGVLLGPGPWVIAAALRGAPGRPP